MCYEYQTGKVPSPVTKGGRPSAHSPTYCFSPARWFGVALLCRRIVAGELFLGLKGEMGIVEWHFREKSMAVQ